jgi:hypothetical protein
MGVALKIARASRAIVTVSLAPQTRLPSAAYDILRQQYVAISNLKAKKFQAIDISDI